MHIKCFGKCRKPNPIFTNNPEKLVLNLLQLKGINGFDKICVTNIITILINIIRLKRIVKRGLEILGLEFVEKTQANIFSRLL